MLNSTQWTQVPRGASGSSQIRAKLFTPWGASLHLSGGDKFLSSLPCEAGIASPSLKAVLVSCMIGTPFGISGSELLLGFCSAQPVMSAIDGIRNWLRRLRLSYAGRGSIGQGGHPRRDPAARQHPLGR